MLQIETITRLDTNSDTLLREWSDLAEECPTATVFQTPQWLATWWKVFGQRSVTRRLLLLTAREQGKLIGLLPLMISHPGVPPLRRVTFLGKGVTDYNDALAAPGREAEVCAAFYAHLAQNHRSELLDFRELRQDGLLRDNPPQKASGLIYADWPLENCPYIDLPTDGSPQQRWHALLAVYSKKMRGNVGYYDRTLRKAFRVEIDTVQRSTDLPQAFSDLFELHQRRWNQRWLPGVFTDKRVRSFHVRAAAELLDRGWLRLTLMRLDDQVQAALYAFAFHDRTCYYQGGFEPELARYSLGSQLIAHSVRTAIEEGFPVFDFLRGNEEYKMRWTREARKTNIRRLIAASPAQLAYAETLHRIENGLESKLKSLFAGGIVRRAPRQRPTETSA